MSTSLVIIVPASLAPVANSLGDALGLGPRNFTVRLAPAGDGTKTPEVTHYGLLHQAAEASFTATMNAAQTGVVPEIDWPAHGLTIEDVEAVLRSMTFSISPDPDPDAEEQVDHASATAHFGYVATGQGLQVMT